MASRQSNGGIFHMQIEKVLGRREKKALEELLEKNYGCRIALQDHNIFMTAGEKIWLASPSINFSIFDLRFGNSLRWVKVELKRIPISG